MLALYIVTACLLSSSVVQASNSAVHVQVFYESLCRHSQLLVGKSLQSAWQVLGDRLDIELVPWGAASASFDAAHHRWDILCQHGPRECLLNKLQGCAVKLEKDSPKALRFSFCLMQSISERSCANVAGLNYDELMKCGQDPDNNYIMIEYGKTTANLRPKLTVIPTLVIDGRIVSYNEADDFLSFYCKFYSDRAPTVCSQTRVEA